MAQRGFAHKLRQFLQTRVGQELAIKDMANGVDLDFGEKARRKLMSTIGDFRKRGELERVAEGVYRYVPPVAAKVTIQEKMWRTLRDRRIVTVEDMQEFAGASPLYAREFLQALSRRKIVARRGEKWALIKDPIAMPQMTEKAARLRRLREKKKKEALAAIDQVGPALLDVVSELSRLRIVINDLPEDEA